MTGDKQQKNNHMVKTILLRLAAHCNVVGLKGLALFLGVSDSKLYGWVRNGNIADTGVILTKCPEINYEWLKTGKGPMLLDNQQQSAAASEGWIEEPQQGYDSSEGGKGGEQIKLFDQGDGPDIPDLLQMVAVVICKKTVYRPALASNVIAFYQAIGGRPKQHEKNDGVPNAKDIV